MELEYTLLVMPTAADLEVAVGKALERGFMPLGGVAVACITEDGEFTQPSFRTTWAQAMFRDPAFFVRESAESKMARKLGAT